MNSRNLMAGLLAIVMTSCAFNYTPKRENCLEKWQKYYQKTDTITQEWLREERYNDYAVQDLDKDGLVDKIEMRSVTPLSYCDVENRLDKKDNTITIRYTGGPDKMYHWDGGLLESYQIILDKGEFVSILTKERLRDGSIISKNLRR